MSKLHSRMIFTIWDSNVSSHYCAVHSYLITYIHTCLLIDLQWSYSDWFNHLYTLLLLAINIFVNCVLTNVLILCYSLSLSISMFSYNFIYSTTLYTLFSLRWISLILFVCGRLVRIRPIAPSLMVGVRVVGEWITILANYLTNCIPINVLISVICVSLSVYWSMNLVETTLLQQPNRWQ